ncbi:MAG: hypothetical protein H0T15_00085, partial [Thermoleophilaceae bacterium]|nr:hypothetical protein [Thermoleophilaceae bacterium]
WRRAALGALGAAWIAAAELLSGEDLLLGQAEGVRPAAEWTGSASDAMAEALWPWLTSAWPAMLGAFALLALAFGALVRGRSVGADLAGALAWAVLAVLALTGVGDLAAGSLGLTEPRGMVVGGLAGVALALAAGASGVMTPPPTDGHEGERP